MEVITIKPPPVYPEKLPPIVIKNCESVPVEGQGLFRPKKFMVHHDPNCKFTWTEIK